MTLTRRLTCTAIAACAAAALLLLLVLPSRSAHAAASLQLYGRVSTGSGFPCPRGVTAGATSTRAENLLAGPGLQVVGYSSAVSTVTQRLGACRALGTTVLVLRIPGGTVTAEGVEFDPDTADLAVTGGTGRYRGAAGELSYTVEPQYGLRLYSLTLDRL